MEAKDRNTATATVADELKAQRRNLTADEWKLIRFSEAEIQELEGLASEEARQDAPRFIVPIFNRHAAELESMANNPEFVKDVFFYAHVFDRDIGGMLQDMAQYSGVIDDAAELHNRIAAHGDKWLLIAEGMRRTYWYFQGCMIREMGGEEYARAIVAFYKSGAKPEYIELDDMPPNGCDTKKRGEANEMGEEKDLPPLIIYHEYLDGLEKSTPDELYKLLHPLMAWHLGREYARPEGLAGIAFDAIQASVERALKIGNVNRNNGRVKSEKKAEAARKNGRHGGRPKKENPTKTQRKPNPNTNTNTILSLDSILSSNNIKPDTDTVTDNRRVSVSVSGTGRNFDPWKCADDEIRYNHTAVEVLTLALGKGAWRRAVDEAGEGGEEGIKELFITFRAEIRAGEGVKNKAAAFTARLKKEFGVLANNATGAE